MRHSGNSTHGGPDSGIAATCYIGVGSNLEDPVSQVQKAFKALGQLRDVSNVGMSSLYLSDPVGPQDQPKYVNAAVQLATLMPPLTLLDALQQIENDQGRARTTHWGARTLDLDLLLYADQTIDSERLTVPHPEMASRSFVLLPLLELSPDILIPGFGSAADLSTQLTNQGIERLDEPPGADGLITDPTEKRSPGSEA